VLGHLWIRVENQMIPSRSPELSIVAPFFNEEEVLAEFSSKLRASLDSLGVAYEVVFVDDGSTDGSKSVINSLNWAQAKTVSLLSNYGHQAALDAGFRASSGAYVISMDCDLQHPPELIQDLYKTAKSELVEVVYAVRTERRREGFFKRTTAAIYYFIMGRLTDVQVRKSAADFRLISRKVVEVLNSLMPGRQVFRLLIPSLGFPSASVSYVAGDRFAGTSKYTLRKMGSLSIESVLQFSTRPLYFATRIGVLVSLLALLGFLYVVVTFFSGQALPGWASLISTILILFGLQFVVLGVLGAYLGQVVKLLQDRPTYLVRDDESKN